MFVCCECRVLSGRGLCERLITRPKESYRLWCVVMYDQETSKTRRLKPATGLWKYNQKGCNARKTNKQTNKQTGHKWNKLRYTEPFSAIFISCVIFSCMFDLKCHNEIKCTTVVGNLFQLRLSSTIMLKSLYFKLTGRVQFIISVSMFAKSHTIFSGRQPRQGAKSSPPFQVVSPWNAG